MRIGTPSELFIMSVSQVALYARMLYAVISVSCLLFSQHSILGEGIIFLFRLISQANGVFNAHC